MIDTATSSPSGDHNKGCACSVFFFSFNDTNGEAFVAVNIYLVII